MRTVLLTLLVWALALSSTANAQQHSSFQLGQDLLGQLEADKNLVFSPYSLQAAFAMTGVGAKGATKQEILKVLHLKPGFELSYKLLNRELSFKRNGVAIANRLWPAKKFQISPKYARRCQTIFGAQPQALDYAKTEAARQTINSWVSKVTHKKIPELLQPGFLDSSVQLALTNAIYFKRKWETEFEPKATRPGTFHSPQGTKTVPMMTHQARHEYYEHREFKVAVLRYLDSEIAMAVVVPTAKDGWKKLRRSLPHNLLTLAQPTSGKIRLTMPKLKFRERLDAKAVMQSLGMKVPFTGQADFSEISPVGGLQLSKASHQAFLEVNEQGTEAGAATVVTMTRSKPRIVGEVIADRPFFFLIFHQPSGATLFMGQVIDPTN